LSLVFLYNSHEVLLISTPLYAKLSFVGTLFNRTLHTKCCAFERDFKLQKALKNWVFSALEAFCSKLYVDLMWTLPPHPFQIQVSSISLSNFLFIIKSLYFKLDWPTNQHAITNTIHIFNRSKIELTNWFHLTNSQTDKLVQFNILKHLFNILKYWENYVEKKIHDKQKNNLHNQSRLIPINRTNTVATLDYANSLKYHKKIN